jgi:hypothetical protein
LAPRRVPAFVSKQIRSFAPRMLGADSLLSMNASASPLSCRRASAASFKHMFPPTKSFLMAQLTLSPEDMQHPAEEAVVSQSGWRFQVS